VGAPGRAPAGWVKLHKRPIAYVDELEGRTEASALGVFKTAKPPMRGFILKPAIGYSAREQA